ncbi:Cysteine-rich RLK (RECEPTOR-like protein kinase) 8 [Theobroma cacao]|uniref:Cysteine-rich RLK (RECEPTOR-like protein kinase) 8 n=1 Tax=Theobroma cacao TaxID=3641 RepID=A0A061GN60_THECC|nr:Cysteine-rich RLK (RECEPTOR-like protein kinase) 8 [Theobroma cacao]
MKNELDALEDKKTWTVVPLFDGAHIIICKWVYKIKLTTDGIIERYKACLLAKGYSQLERFDYHETFSPIAKHTTVRVFLATAAIKGWHLSQLDINNAFFNGHLDEVVYMDFPQGYAFQGECSMTSRIVRRLNKSLYGLKQAFRHWNCLEVASSKKGIFVCQRKYALDLINEYGLPGAKPLATPTEYNNKLSKDNGGTILTDSTMYGQLVGKLLYLTFTRPDIAYSVQVLSQFMDKLTVGHLQATYRVLKYLKKASGQGILLFSTSNIHLTVYTDTDWTGCRDTRRLPHRSPEIQHSMKEPSTSRWIATLLERKCKLVLYFHSMSLPRIELQISSPKLYDLHNFMDFSAR